MILKKALSFLWYSVSDIILIRLLCMEEIKMFLIETIKDDWSYRLPERLKYNRYRGTNRLSYQFLCLLYYPMKTLFLLVLSVYYYLFYGLYLLLKFFFERKDVYYEDDEYEECFEEDTSIETDAINANYSNAAINNESKTNKLKLLWYYGSENEWKKALIYYDDMLGSEQKIIEDYINNIDADEVNNLNGNEFYEFLYHKYFVWKYTQKNRLATTRMNLEKYIDNDELSKLESIKERLFRAEKSDVSKCLEIATEIYGLGTAGASGLLAILFPEFFGTVDQFVVKSLREIEHPVYKEVLNGMKPESLNNKDGAILIKIMREKAAELNIQFNTDFWTPRKIDMILWSFGR